MTVFILLIREIFSFLLLQQLWCADVLLILLVRCLARTVINREVLGHVYCLLFLRRVNVDIVHVQEDFFFNVCTRVESCVIAFALGVKYLCVNFLLLLFFVVAFTAEGHVGFCATDAFSFFWAAGSESEVCVHAAYLADSAQFDYFLRERDEF